MNNFIPRPSQQNILRYTSGRLGIAAVLALARRTSSRRWRVWKKSLA